MADTNISVAQDQFSCPICLDLVKDPVTIPCGHSYCMSCITDCWDQDEDQIEVNKCSQCRQTFTPRPVLGKNIMLTEVVENVRKRKLQAARPARCFGESGTCDVCIEEKHKAVKSCLVCLESYCQNHLERHEEFHSRKRHKMTDDTGRLEEMICPQHDKLLAMYCRTDQSCICLECLEDEHKTHHTVSLYKARTEKQVHLVENQRNLQQRIQERQKELQEIRESVETCKRSAQAAVEDSERIFTELIRSIERSRSEVIQLIRDQEKTEVSRTEELLKRLEQEIDDLRRRDTELEQLSHTDDHIHFLQSFQSLSVPPGSTDSLNITVSSLLSFDDVGKSVSHLREKLENFCREETKTICERVKRTEIIFSQNPKIREEFLQYSHQLTLDPNTAHKCLCLSEGNRVITFTETLQSYPDHPDRFDDCQVLCRESLSGRCYWEVEWSGDVSISVSYKSISRKGRDNECRFGCNDQSWSLFCSDLSFSFCSDSSFSFYHNNIKTELPVVYRSSRIGVYVDHSAGTLSFYSVSDTMTLIHRVQTTFTQPLYPGFGICPLFMGRVKMCDVTK